jgi:hypothetical protein
MQFHLESSRCHRQLKRCIAARTTDSMSSTLGRLVTTSRNILGASDLGVGSALRSGSPTRTWRDCDRLSDQTELTLKSETPDLDQSKRCTESINAGVSTNTATNTQAARTITRPRRGTPKSGWRGRKFREILDHLGPDFDQYAWRHQHLATAAPSAQNDLWTVQHSRIDPNREVVR